MNSLILSRSALGFVVGTRAALASGIGLLVAGRMPKPRRRALALMLIGVGAATTLPAARLVFGRRHALEGGPLFL